MNYTDDEISDVLNEMGFAVPEQDVLNQIRDGLCELLSHDPLFSSFLINWCLLFQ